MKLAELLNERKRVNEEIKMVKQRLYLSTHFGSKPFWVKAGGYPWE